MSIKVERTPESEKLRLVVRLSTSTFFTKRGVSSKKDITVLSRKSDLRLGDVFCEPEEMHRIVNLHRCEDGVYEITWVNVSHDWETGYPDDWDYKMIPYEEEQ